MITKDIHNFGNIYRLTEEEIKKFETLSGLFEEEQNFMLELKKKFNLEVREDLLILFVQMYLLRFAIPYFQITQNKFPDISNRVFLKKILYYCLIGRFVDDLVDNDSKMFKTYESILLYQKYYPKLSAVHSSDEKENFDNYLFDSTKYKSPILEDSLSFENIKKDIYERIKYFFCESEKYADLNQENLKIYTGILLGGLDLNDLIADGYSKNSSTVISNHVYNKYYNDEGKLLLDEKLLNFYSSIKIIFSKEKEQLLEYCESNKLFYTANLLKIQFL
jgi:hypothetical protein